MVKNMVKTEEAEQSITEKALAVMKPSRRTIAQIAPTIKRQVTRPLLKHSPGQLVNIEILSPMYEGRELSNTQIKQRATLVNVRNLDADASDAEYIYIVSSVLASVLKEEYPNNTYVGAWLGIYKLAPDEARGKRYNTYSIVEYDRTN